MTRTSLLTFISAADSSSAVALLTGDVGERGDVGDIGVIIADGEVRAATGEVWERKEKKRKEKKWGEKRREEEKGWERREKIAER